jgi:hypothetical protein
MQKQENNSINPLQTSALLNINWLKWRSGFLLANLPYTGQRNGLMTRRGIIACRKPFNESMLGAAEEYAIECAMLKVYGSEVLDFVVDEGVQIHGGNGFSAEYNISRAYRDSRINRIYEELMKSIALLILDMTLKRAMQKRLDMMGPAMAVQKELMEYS